MLGVVQSIARLTSANNPHDFMERFSERVRALAANHDLLVSSDWTGVDVEDLVGAQLALIAIGSAAIWRCSM
jgi:two-component sensor histidine kinase